MKKLIAVLAIGAGIFVAFGDKLKNMYDAQMLYQESNIVNNFSNMGQIFDLVEIKPSAPASHFEQAEKPLPETYLYKGENRNTHYYIEKTNTTGLLVVKDNTITFEDYYLGTEATDHRISWSMAKSYLSALFGIAVHEGHIKSIEQAVTDYVPSLKGSGYDGVRIKDVLQMSSGVGFNEDYMDLFSDINRFSRTFYFGGSMDDFAATLKNEREPGTYLHYVSIDTHVLGMVLRAATGREIVDLFNDKIWSKIQPESSAYYMVDQFNEPMVLGGLNIRTRDYARFGQLYLNNGNWKGEQIVPAEWVKQSITPDAPHLIPGKRDTAKRTLGYGFQWWIPEHSDQEFMALGIYGQYIYINQKLGVVIVKNSGDTKFTENNYEATVETIAFFRSIAQSLQN